MKKIFTLLIGIVFSLTILNAQDAPPQAFSFKATIKGANNQPVVNQMINLKITILQDDINDIATYSEYFTPTTNHYSQVDVEIGKGHVLSGIFSSIDWSAHNYFLKAEVDAKGGTNYQLMSVSQLLSVPYAMYAGEAGSVSNYNETDPLFKVHAASGITSGDIGNWNAAFGWGDHPWSQNGSNVFLNSGNVGIGTDTPTQMLTVDGNAEIMGNIIPNGKITAPGNIIIESSGNNVIILAGANKITIDPSGGVTIESSSITLAATNDLTLSAPNVHINGTTVDINSTNTNISSSQTTNIKSMDTNIESQMSTALRATGIDIEANASLKLSAVASTELSASGITKIKGTLVMIN